MIELVLQYRSGPSAASLKFNRPRKKLKVDLDRMVIKLSSYIDIY